MGDVVHESEKGTNEEMTRETDIKDLQIAFQDWLNSLQWKALKDPDGHACLTGNCGETIEIFLNFNGERVKEAAYLTNGCISSRVCAALAAHMAHGKTPDQLLDITAQCILGLLGDFPKEQEHCAFLAAETLQEALHNYMIKQSNT
jgi:nitrogen fixation protein NifU and related proteins